MKLVSTDLLLVERLFTAVYWPATLWIQKVVLLFLYPKVLVEPAQFSKKYCSSLLRRWWNWTATNLRPHIHIQTDIGNHFSWKFLHQKTLIRRVSPVTLLTWRQKTNTFSWHGFLFIFKDLLFHFALLYYSVKNVVTLCFKNALHFA